MAKATRGWAVFNGVVHECSTSFQFASFYRCNWEDRGDKLMIRFHRTEKAAQKGTWDSPAMREGWDYVGYTEVLREEPTRQTRTVRTDLSYIPCTDETCDACYR